LIRKTEDVDLDRIGGYALTGAWVRWGETISLSSGEFLVCACERGSRNHHGYCYALVEGGDEAREIERDEQEKYIAEGHVTEQERAYGMNSTLQRFALYTSLRIKDLEAKEVEA